MDYTDDWPRIRQRYEAFWHGEILDRPLIAVRAPKANPPPAVAGDAPPADAPALLEWFMNPAQVIPRLHRQLAKTHHAGDAFPVAFPVSFSLPAIQAAYLGGRYRIAPGNLSGWCDPIIDDWRTRKPFVVNPDELWWQRSQRLLEAGAAGMADIAAIGIPDLQGGGQILDLLRGTERLATDLIEEPDAVHAALKEIDETWLEYWRACNAILLPSQQGYIDWLQVWSDRPAVTVECDFSIMISARQFAEFFLPGIEKQTRWVERTIYHLDGEGAIRHLDALLALDTLDGIQWVPGAGAKPMREWIPLLRRIRDGGKLLVLGCDPTEVEFLLRELGPKGVFLQARCESEKAADALLDTVTRQRY